MSLPHSLPVARLSILLITLLTATIALAEETAARDSARVEIEPAATIAAETTAVPGSAWGALSATAAEEEKKKRVKKKEPRKKNDRGGNAEEEDEDESCVDSCIGGFIASIFASSSEPESTFQPEESPHPYQPTPAPAAEVAGEPEADEPEPERVVVPADFSLVLDLSMWKSGPSEVSEEYKDGGGRFGVSAYFIPSENFEVGVDIGVAAAQGRPLYDYETSTRLESPQISHLWMIDSGLRFGMIHTFSQKGPFLRWGLGPRVYWVKENATLEVYELPSMIRLEDTKDALEAWRLGGDLSVSMLWDTNSSVLVGFSMRLFVVPWESSFTHSLTLDHIGKKSLVGFNLGLAIHFNGF